MVLTGGNTADTTMLAATLDDICVPRSGSGRPRTRPDRVLADKGYPSKANRAWLRARGIAATIPERNDQIAHRQNQPGRPIDFGAQQKKRYKGRNVVERCFNGNAEGLVDSFPYAASSTVVFMIASYSMGVNFPSRRCRRRRW